MFPIIYIRGPGGGGNLTYNKNKYPRRIFFGAETVR